MTDAPIDPGRFIDDEALVFEDEEAAPAVAAPASKTKRRRAPRGGADRSEPAAEAAPETEPPAAVAPPEAAPVATTTDAPHDANAAPPVDVTASPRLSPFRRYALPAIVGLSLVSSFASVGGLIAVGRSLADLRVERARAAEESEALAHVPATVAKLDRAVATLAAAAAQPAPAGGISPDDLRHALDDLRLALAARQPQGVSALVDQSRSSFSEIATRLDRIEQAMRRPAVVRPAPSLR